MRRDNLVIVKKKGKTRGRPSKIELFMSGQLSKIMNENRDAILKANEDLILNGRGAVAIKWEESK